MSNKLKFVTSTKEPNVSLIDLDTQVYHDRMLPGFYKVNVTNLLPFQIIREMHSTNVTIPTSALKTSNLIVDINVVLNKFSDKRKRVNSALGINNQAGVLFHGIQGSGKSTTMNAIAKTFINSHNAVAVAIEDYNDIEFVLEFTKEARKLEDFLLIIIMDECEDLFKHSEDEIKQLLDGRNSIDNVIYLAATNYIEDIPNTIKERPSRFDLVVDCSTLKEEDVIFYILNEMNSTLDDQDKLTDEFIRKELTPLCKDKTLDELKHVFINHVTK